MATTIDQTWIDEAIQWRRDFHRSPELAYEEETTSKKIAHLLSQWGLKVTTGLAKTGVIGTLGDGSGPSIGLRADIDALPIEEESGVEHTSETAGIMHACGHDGHTAILLLAARHFSQNWLGNGTIHFIFQPAEENEAGARAMIEDGLFDQARCDSVFALHNWPDLDVGECCIADGAMMAAFAIFDIRVSGRGGHAAMPHQAASVISAAAGITEALHQLPARSVSPFDPVVLSVTQIHSGSTWNVSPEKAVISGTTRWFSEGAGAILERQLRETAQHYALARGCEVHVDYRHKYPATVNNPTMARRAREAAAGAGLKLSDGAPSMASEDFAFMLEERPGAYMWLGARRDGENPGLHSPRYDFNDALVPAGAELWCRLVQQMLV